MKEKMNCSVSTVLYVEYVSEKYLYRDIIRYMLIQNEQSIEHRLLESIGTIIQSSIFI